MSRRQAVESWPNRAAAAGELGVILNQPTLTVKTLEGWLGDPSCPLPRGRGPVPKVPMLIWIIAAKKGPGRPADSSTNEIRHANAEIAKAKAAALLGRVYSVESVNNAIDAAMDELAREFTETIPATISEMIGKKPAEDILDEHRALAEAALNRFSAAGRTGAA